MLTLLLLDLTGPRDTAADIALSATWEPTLAALSIQASATPLDSTDLAVDPPAELRISPIDLQGGYHSRAARTERFNEKKRDKAAYGNRAREADIGGRRQKAKGGEIGLEENEA